METFAFNVALILTVLFGIPVFGAFIVVGMDKVEALFFRLWR